MRSVTVFARRPRPGTVKSRLSPALPPAAACRLYRGMLRDALEAARGSAADRRLVHWDGPDAVDADLPGAGLESALQRGRDLGERLAAAFEELLRAPGDRAVAIGADCPDLGVAAVDGAFAALETHDLALAPSADGGYALIGLSRPAPALFEGVEWGGAAVLEQTLARAASLRLRVTMRETLSDVDTPADLVRWIAGALYRPASGRGTHTAAALVELGLLPRRG